MTCPVPPVTDPLGKYWPQPDPNNFAFDDANVLMTRKDFDRLLHYQTSNPSGVYEGKIWRRGPWLVWYGPSEYPDKCRTYFRKIIIADEPTEPDFQI